MAQHRLSKRQVRTTAALAGFAVAIGVTVAIASSDGTGTARADGAGQADQYVDIRTVRPNVKNPKLERDATTGTFTVNCGKNENGHFNPDNFIAQPGVRNGAQHLHDYVGNLSTNADSTNESLLRAGTTCGNGDKSAYFWPVIRINEDDEEPQNPPKKRTNDSGGQEAAKPVANCPDVAAELPDVPEEVEPEVQKSLEALDAQVDAADRQLATTPGKDGSAEGILRLLKEKRAAMIGQMSAAIARKAEQPQGLDKLAECTVGNGNDKVFTGQKATLQDADQNNELPGNEGEIQRPEVVKLTFEGSPVGSVRAMPKFLRVLYGDAKPTTNGPKNTRPSWTCTGFENRLIDKYPICPSGSKVERIHEFPSCWDGKNIDSKNHRDHIVYPNAAGQ